MNRKIIQLVPFQAIAIPGVEDTVTHHFSFVIALCDDGTVWRCVDPANKSNWKEIPTNSVMEQ
jgi:hypothetical protein